MLKFIGKFAIQLMAVILIISFAAWGIGDVLRSNNRNDVATVGNESVSHDEYAKALARYVQRMQQVFGDQFTPEMLKSMGVERGVINQLVERHMLIMEARRLGIATSDEQIINVIASNPNFHDDKGQFSKAVFTRFLKQSGQNERSFITQVKNEQSLEILMSSVLSGTPSFEAENKLLYQHQLEKREANILLIPADFSVTLSEPTDPELLTFYEDRKAQFTIPETRNATTVILDEGSVATEAAPSEDEMKEAYDSRAEEFSLPERRVLQHMLFETEGQAKAAYDSLKQGQDFALIAKEKAHQTTQQTNFGEATQSDLLENAAPIVFALGKNEFTEPLPSPLGFHIFKVVDILPSLTKPYAEVKDQIEKSLRAEKSQELLYQLSNQLSDMLAGGSTMEEVASKLKLKLVSLSNLGNDGANAELNTLFPAPQNKENANKENTDKTEFLANVFALESGQYSQPVSTNISAKPFTYIVRVDTIQPARERALDEVRGSVVAAWKKEQQDLGLKAMAEKIAAADAPLSEEARKQTLSFKSGIILERAPNAASASLPESLLADLFNHRLNEKTSVHKNAEGAYVIAEVKKIISISTDNAAPEALQQVAQKTREEAESDIYQQYLLYLRKRYPVRIHLSDDAKP